MLAFCRSCVPIYGARRDRKDFKGLKGSKAPYLPIVLPPDETVPTETLRETMVALYRGMLQLIRVAFRHIQAIAAVESLSQHHPIRVSTFCAVVPNRAAGARKRWRRSSIRISAPPVSKGALSYQAN
jgi:hypothetical protein